jgi:putative ABC transport system substrate-binding protein
MTNRRDFITLLGGAAAWPAAARAQQADRMRRIGVMMLFPEDNRYGREQADALRRGLQDLGWTDGRNIRIDFHWDIGEPGRAQLIAKDIIAVQPDLIVSQGAAATPAVAGLTKSIPIVFVGITDPVAGGMIPSYARPGSNVTGFSNFEPSMAGKWVEVLKDIDPGIRRAAILFYPDTVLTRPFLTAFEAAGASLGVEPIEAPVRDIAEIEPAIDAFARQPNGALVGMPESFIGQNIELICRSALSHRLPLIGGYPTYTDTGALVSYGINARDLFHRAAAYVDRILKGAKPADLPAQTPTKFEMVINLKTAKALGLNLSREFLLLADEVIE